MAPERPTGGRRNDPRFAVRPSAPRAAFKSPRYPPATRARLVANHHLRCSSNAPGPSVPIHAGDVQRAAGGVRAVRDARGEAVRGEGSLPGRLQRRRAGARAGRDLRAARLVHVPLRPRRDRVRGGQGRIVDARRGDREAQVRDRRVARAAKRGEDRPGRREVLRDGRRDERGSIVVKKNWLRGLVVALVPRGPRLDALLRTYQRVPKTLSNP